MFSNSKKWVYPPEVDINLVEKLSEELNILPVTATILIRRGLNNPEEIKPFLDTRGSRLSDYRRLSGTEEAGRLIAAAIKEKKLIVLFGDYDVDGVTSSAVMAEFIRSRGGEILVHLPDRYSEGYGLNKTIIDKACSLKAGLLVTVDCGITAVEEVAYANSKQLDVVITDHHEPAEMIPEAKAVVNPKVTGPQELTILAGVGVTLQVVRAIADALGEQDQEKLRKHLDLVALGTVADVVPLVGENRLLTKAGLAVINRGHRLGLKALLTTAGCGVEPVNSTDLAFRIAPRLNAAGRMGDANISLELLLANDALEADELAEKLNQENIKRQQIQKRVLEEAERQLDTGYLPKVLIVAGENWPHGVVGLVAARLCEKYYRPCFALSVKDDEVKGSGRSIKGFSLHDALSEMSSFLQKWGGHEMAAGVTLSRNQLPKFRQVLTGLADELLDRDRLIPELIIDVETGLKQVDFQLLQELKKFEPFGFGNIKPLFVIDRLSLSCPARIVGDRHIKMKLTDDQGESIDVIGFGLGERIEELAGNKKIAIAGFPSENNWNGTTSIQFELKDFKAAE